MRPLFDEFPELMGKVAHQQIASLPTPVQPLPIGRNNWVKRDDITHPVYGGNKIRKLEFIIADAVARGKSRIVTFGAIGTNHGVATAMVCRQVGLRCRIYLFDQPLTDVVRQNLRLMQAFGAELKYCGSLARTVWAFYTSPARAARQNYFLFAGGSSPIGTLGFINAAFELRQQIATQQLPQPRAIVCPVGSGATLAGLTLGMSLARLPIEVIGVRVAPSHLGPLPVCTRQTVYGLMVRTQGLLTKHVQFPSSPVKPPNLLNDYFGSGYGASTTEARSATEIFGKSGIQLESTYTAKAAAAFLSIQTAIDGPTLFWNTFNSRNVSEFAAVADSLQLPTALRQL
ncbi:MAG: pyridoxal-phosphate dependent enzyme [Pirellulaceae bacterium]|nr:pyridoxal-phosphate dependent enzyme [Pirellulaceae bacterium]